MGNIRLAAHRQIGYAGEKEETKVEIIKKIVSAKKPIIKNTTASESGKIFQWIEEHKKFFSINALCKEVGLDTSNFNKLYKKGGEIPEQFIAPIKTILENYGYI